MITSLQNVLLDFGNVFLVTLLSGRITLKSITNKFIFKKHFLVFHNDENTPSSVRYSSSETACFRDCNRFFFAFTAFISIYPVFKCTQIFMGLDFNGPCENFAGLCIPLSFITSFRQQFNAAERN